jgi:hypothetical protein
MFRDQTLETVGQAIAIKSRPYLTAATINLQTAATIDTATT